MMAGPYLLPSRFVDELNQPTKYSFRHFISELVHCLLWIVGIEVLLQLVFIHALHDSESAMKQLDKWALGGAGFFVCHIDRWMISYLSHIFVRSYMAWSAFPSQIYGAVWYPTSPSEC